MGPNMNGVGGDDNKARLRQVFSGCVVSVNPQGLNMI